MDLDLTTVIQELKAIGISVRSELRIKELDGNYNKPPHELYAVILGFTGAKCFQGSLLSALEELGAVMKGWKILNSSL